MKTLTIEPPKGQVIDFDQKTCTIKFKEEPKDIMERIQSVEDALRELGDADDEVITYKKVLSVLTADNHLLNYQTAVVLIRAINEKREPDWDSNEAKYFNYFIMGGSSGFHFNAYDAWGSYSVVGSRLAFFNPKHGEYLAKKFPNVFKNFMLIIKK